MTINARNPSYSNAQNTAIGLEVEHPEYGWIPFTATPNDVEQHGRDLYAEAKAGKFGAVAPYVAPPPMPEPVPEQVSRAQGKAVLVQNNLWKDVLAYVETLQEPDKTMAQIALNDTTHWRRDSPFLNAAADALNITSEQMDDMFIAASKILL